jgi:histidine kinase/DNA gyrase B/HSP90-like ATPase
MLPVLLWSKDHPQDARLPCRPRSKPRETRRCAGRANCGRRVRRVKRRLPRGGPSGAGRRPDPLGLALADRAVTISVSDTGIGIAPEDQGAIFEEFRQVGGDEARQEGTGLGLTLSKKFIEMHGGRIWVESEVGRGSTFTFTRRSITAKGARAPHEAKERLHSRADLPPRRWQRRGQPLLTSGQNVPTRAPTRQMVNRRRRRSTWSEGGSYSGVGAVMISASTASGAPGRARRKP